MSEIKVTRSLGAAMSDSDKFGWQVSYVYRQFETRIDAEREAERLRLQPTAAEVKAISEGRYVDLSEAEYLCLTEAAWR